MLINVTPCIRHDMQITFIFGLLKQIDVQKSVRGKKTFLIGMYVSSAFLGNKIDFANFKHFMFTYLIFQSCFRTKWLKSQQEM